MALPRDWTDEDTARFKARLDRMMAHPAWAKQRPYLIKVAAYVARFGQPTIRQELHVDKLDNEGCRRIELSKYDPRLRIVGKDWEKREKERRAKWLKNQMRLRS